MTIAAAPDLERLVRREHNDPHSILGAHPHADGVVIRASAPGRRGGPRGRSTAQTVALEQIHPGGVFEGAGRRRRAAARTTARGRLRRRRHGHDRGPVPLPADARRARPAPARRGPPRGAVGRASARTCASSRASAARRSPSGRRPRAPSRVVGDFNCWDGRIHPMRSLGSSGIWELFLPGVGGGAALQVRDPRPGRRDPAEGRPGRVRHRGAAEDRLGRLRVRARVGRRGVAGAAPQRRAARRARCRSTRSTSARGG